MSFSRVNYCDMFRAQGLDVCWYYKTDTTFFVKVISMSLIVSLGLVGNFFLAFVILSSKRLRDKSVNIFIVNLSISNCLNLSFTAPIIAVDSVTEFFELGDFICHAMRCVQVIFFVVPMLTLLVISVDRYLHIQNLMRDQNYTWKTFLVCLVIWGLGIGLGSSEYRYKTYSVTEFKDILDKKCYDNYYKDGLDETNKWEFERIYWYVHILLIYSSLIHIIRFSMLAVVFLIPFTGLLLFYTRILVKIRQIMGELAYHDQPHSKTLHNVTVMIITVLFTTMICWSPMTVFWFIKYMPLVPPRHEVLPANPNLKKPFGSSEGFRYIGETCIFLHCTLQPIIYFLTATNLRRGLGRWLPCIKIKVKGVKQKILDPCFARHTSASMNWISKILLPTQHYIPLYVG